MDAELAISWTIRLSMAAFVFSLILRFGWPESRLARWTWFFGWILALAHVLLVFQFVHGWSHAEAVADTARKTQEQVGIAVGTGVLTKAIFVEHIASVWQDPTIAGFDEIIDLTAADLSSLSTADVQSLVNSGVNVDAPTQSRLALVVGNEIDFGLGRMYGSMRETHASNARNVGIFYDRQSAVDWLDDVEQ